ncbi:hypothetical protein BGZ73_001763, partial [Actinomortierella ambigua]
MDAGSDDELALLEQLEQAKRIQAQIEAKLAAKRQKAQAQALEQKDAPPAAAQHAAVGSSSSSPAQLATGDNRTTTASSSASSSSSSSRTRVTRSATGARAGSAGTTNTTPPVATEPLVSATPANQLLATTPADPPKFRTPSPRAMNPFLVSPPSGAMSRKRQHSPSPLPRSTRRPSWATPSRGTPGTAAAGGRGGDGSSMLSPSRGRSRYGRVVDVASLSGVARDFPAELREVNRTETKAKAEAGEGGTEGSNGDKEHDIAAKNENSDNHNHNHDGDYDDNNNDDGAYPSLPDGEELDAFVDQLEVPLDEEDDHGSAAHDEEDKRQKDAQSQFVTTAEPEVETKSSQDTSSNNTTAATSSVVGTDTLTGFRLSARDIDQKELDERLSTHTFYELKDTEGIREVGHRPSHLGLLPSTKPGGRLNPTVPSSSSGSKNAAAGSAGAGEGATTSKVQGWQEWVVAGVVSAKSKPRTTAKQVRYFHFQLSDLRNHEMNVFMFREVMDKHYSQLRVGQVVALFSPKLLSQTD